MSNLTAVSLIFTTYNREETLQPAILSAFEQTRLPEEIIVADDGSREDTAELIRMLAAKSPVPLIHVWQPDEGFRAARSRNNAIAVASGTYLIFADGDCFLHRHFVADHLTFAKGHQFIAGTRVNIQQKRLDYILRTGDRRLHCGSWGITKRFNAIRCLSVARGSNAEKDMLSVNFSVSRADVLRVNGFDEWFTGHGGEDTDLEIRLLNGGIAKRRMVHAGILYHCCHGHTVLTPEKREAINRRHRETRTKRTVRAEQGLDRAARALLDGTVDRSENHLFRFS